MKKEKICGKDDKRSFPSYDPTKPLIEVSGNEQELWATVMHEAVETAVMQSEAAETLANLSIKDPSFKKYRGKRRERKYRQRVKNLEERIREDLLFKDRARQFFRENDGMFSLICFWLNMDVEKTRKAVMAQW